jgi:RNA polymerase sigma-70 factor, ECF subfamily
MRLFRERWQSGNKAVPGPDPVPPEITEMLKAWSKGESAPAEEVFALLYDELRKRAHNSLRRDRPGHTLQTTALINETYIKLREQRIIEWESRAHFFAICATLMRRILIDYAKSKHRAKRGGYAQHVTIDGLALADRQQTDIDVVALDDALNRLAELDPAQARIVELRYFSGFTIEDTAAVLGLSDSTVKREWRVAKAWLRFELEARTPL